ncbi:MAG: hypothetical protein HZC47_01240 [Methanobacterium sp.]|uniref:hypothetical protein n=1 Tax=Methanobacterium sp. TaxID=2164 RepID=UPI003D64722B|nr:hypothetical protein [Methanobacterium sp.]
MDNKGFIFTLDAVLAVIPVFIILTAVTYISSDFSAPAPQIRASNEAHDILETMATYKSTPTDFTALQSVTDALKTKNYDSAEQIAGSYFNKTMGSLKYNFTEVNQLNTTIAANADMKNGRNIAVGVKNCGGYTFKLYIWD